MNVTALQLLAGMMQPGQASGAFAPGAAAGSPLFSLLQGAVPGITPATSPEEAFSLLLASMQPAAGGQQADTGIPALTAGTDDDKKDQANTALPASLLPLFAFIAQQLPDTAFTADGQNIPVLQGVTPTVTANATDNITQAQDMNALLESLQATLAGLSMPENGFAGDMAPAAGQATNVVPVGYTSQKDSLSFKLFQQLQANQALQPDDNSLPEGIVIPNVGVVTPQTAVNHATTPQNPQVTLPQTMDNQLAAADISQIQAVNAPVIQSNDKQQAAQNQIAVNPQDVSQQKTITGEAVAPVVEQQVVVNNAKAVVKDISTVKAALENTMDDGNSDTSFGIVANNGKNIALSQLHHGAKLYALNQGTAGNEEVITDRHRSGDKIDALRAEIDSLLGNDTGLGTSKQADALGKHIQLRQAMTTLPAWEQITMQVVHSMKDGKNKINLQLEPASLGKVEVRLDFSHDGKTSIVVAVDRSETLELLQRDARQLQDALANAGVKADAGNLSFSLRQEGEFQQGGFAGNNTGRESSRSYQAPEDEISKIVPLMMMNRPDGLDIRV